MKKILILGSADSIFVRDFISQIATQGVAIDLISFSGASNNKNVRVEVNVALDSKKRSVLGRQVELFFKIRAALKKMEGGYDAVVLHFIFFFLAPHVFFMRNLTKNIVAVIWGSDFYRAGKIQALIQKVIYHSARTVVFTNPATRKEFERKNRLIPVDRLKVARFGLPVLDEIKKINLVGIERKRVCDEFGFPENKVLIFAGYNANLSQQQLFVIEEFGKLGRVVKEKATLVFTLGYGDNSAEDKIRNSLELHGVDNYVILNKFYGFQEIAKIRCVTDVLINIQPTDQFSGSMQEVLYAGGRVIAGGWLPYEEILETGAEIKCIKTRDEIAGAMESEIGRGIKNAISANEGTKEFIENSSSWSQNLKIWNGIISS